MSRRNHEAQGGAVGIRRLRGRLVARMAILRPQALQGPATAGREARAHLSPTFGADLS
jgi:hypothetical protein